MLSHELAIQALLLLIAILANLLSALAGGGAGLVQLPALILLGLNFPIALATHKVASVALGLGAGLRHAREGRLNRELTAFILLCGLPGVWVGSNIVLSIPDSVASTFLGLMNLLLGYLSLKSTSEGTKDNLNHKSNASYTIGGLILFLIGILNGSISSGTGLFVTIWLVRWFGLSYTQAVGYTLILVGIFWNGTGAVILASEGAVKWEWIISLIAGSLIGGYLGANMAISRGNIFVKKVFIFLCFLMGGSLILKNFI